MSVQDPKGDHGDLEGELIEAYKANFDQEPRPDWAVRNREHPEELIRPSVPFVGRNYSGAKTRILVYASAENLTDYEEGKGSKLLESEDAWNRRRVTFDKREWGFFPDVHMRPVDDGWLPTAVAHLAEVYDLLPPSDSPCALLEEIAVDNLCKFSIANPGGPNIDYAWDERKIEYSLPYIKDDMRVLKPDVVLLPSTSWKLEAVQSLFGDHSPKPKVVPIYQITRGVMNRNIKPQHTPSSIEERRSQVSKPYQEWAQMVGEPDSYYFLEHVLTRAKNIL